VLAEKPKSRHKLKTDKKFSEDNKLKNRVISFSLAFLIGK